MTSIEWRNSSESVAANSNSEVKPDLLFYDDGSIINPARNEHFLYNHFLDNPQTVLDLPAIKSQFFNEIKSKGNAVSDQESRVYVGLARKLLDQSGLPNKIYTIPNWGYYYDRDISQLPGESVTVPIPRVYSTSELSRIHSQLETFHYSPQGKRDYLTNGLTMTEVTVVLTMMGMYQNPVKHHQLMMPAGILSAEEESYLDLDIYTSLKQNLTIRIKNIRAWLRDHRLPYKITTIFGEAYQLDPVQNN